MRFRVQSSCHAAMLGGLLSTPMFFTDSSGFFSLVCLMMQCIIAWIFAAFFGVLAPGRPIWMHSFRVAFVGWAIGLTAIATRFTVLHVGDASISRLPDGALETRVLYAFYLAGKILFLAGMLRGVSSWRSGRILIPIRATVALMALASVVGFVLPSVESLLLFQVPLVMLVCILSARLLRPHDDLDRANRSRATVRGVLLLMAVAWCVYGIATVWQFARGGEEVFLLGMIVRLNSLIDLLLQVVLAAGLIIAVMTEAYDRVVVAQKERDSLRDQIQRDDKLRASATLISGVAHEINNPLTAIIGYGEELASSDPVVRMHAVRVVREQAARCRAIVKRMSAIGRRRLLTTSSFQVPALVEQVVDGLRPQIEHSGVDVSVEAPADLSLVADSTGFEQVLTNLISNAIQVSKPRQSIVVSAAVCEGGVELCVRDHGPGVPDADREHIFEPFWTTKRPSHGGGLGLAVVDAIVHAHAGKIEVDDADGGGAVFRIVWPLRSLCPVEAETADELAALPEVMASSNPQASNQVPETQCDPVRSLLVIDDEDLVRMTIRRHAERSGWNVEDVASGDLGLARLLDGEHSYDAVVCDMRMPGMSGIELHDRLRKQVPELLRITLFVTGDLSSPEALDFAGRCQVPLLAKPFSPQELMQRLAELAP